MAFEGVHIQLSEDSLYRVFLVRPTFQDAQIYLSEDTFFTVIEAVEQRENNFIWKACKIQPLPQVDTEIQAVTTWTPATRKTYAELVSQAAASPGVGLKGHIEIVYDGAPALNNIARIEINVEADRKKTIYTFNIA